MSNSSHLEDGCVLREGRKSILDGAILIFIALFAMIGNLVVLIAFSKYRNLRTITNIFIVSVAAADIFVAILPIPMTFAVYICSWLTTGNYGKTAESAYMVCDVLASSVSIISLTAVAVEKFIAISWPFRHHRIVTYPVAFAAVAIVWGCGLAYSILTLYMDTMQYTVFIMISTYVIPVTIMAVCYIHIAIIGRRHARRIGALEMSAKHYREEVSGRAEISRRDTDLSAGKYQESKAGMNALNRRNTDPPTNLNSNTIKERAELNRRDTDLSTKQMGDTTRSDLHCRDAGLIARRNQDTSLERPDLNQKETDTSSN